MWLLERLSKKLVFRQAAHNPDSCDINQLCFTTSETIHLHKEWHLNFKSLPSLSYWSIYFHHYSFPWRAYKRHTQKLLMGETDKTQSFSNFCILLLLLFCFKQVNLTQKWWWWLFPRLQGFWENVKFIHSPPALFSKVEISLCTPIPLFRPESVHSGSASWDDWPNVPWQVACELVSGQVPTLCLDSGIVSPLRHGWFKSVRVFKCNLPPTLWAEWPGSFTCHCSNMEGGGMDTE